jgi:hypothetical protein
MMESSRLLAIIAALGAECRLPAAELARKVDQLVSSYGDNKEASRSLGDLVGSHAAQKSHWLKIDKAVVAIRELVFDPLSSPEDHDAAWGAVSTGLVCGTTLREDLAPVLAALDEGSARVKNGNSIQGVMERRYGRQDYLTRGFVIDMAAIYSEATGETPHFTRDPITDEWRSKFCDFCIIALAGNLQNVPSPGAIYQVYRRAQLQQVAENARSPSLSDGPIVHTYVATETKQVANDETTDAD